MSGTVHWDLDHAAVSITLRFFGDRFTLESFFINLGEPVSKQVSATVVASIKIDDRHDRSALTWKEDWERPAELVHLAAKITQQIVCDNAA